MTRIFSVCIVFGILHLFLVSVLLVVHAAAFSYMPLLYKIQYQGFAAINCIISAINLHIIH